VRKLFGVALLAAGLALIFTGVIGAIGFHLGIGVMIAGGVAIAGFGPEGGGGPNERRCASEPGGSDGGGGASDGGGGGGD